MNDMITVWQLSLGNDKVYWGYHHHCVFNVMGWWWMESVFPLYSLMHPTLGICTRYNVSMQDISTNSFACNNKTDGGRRRCLNFDYAVLSLPLPCRVGIINCLRLMKSVVFHKCQSPEITTVHHICCIVQRSHILRGTMDSRYIAVPYGTITLTLH